MRSKAISKQKKVKNIKTGKGFINSLINKLPFEAHVPGYQFCGPGTKLKQRLAAKQNGINELDRLCKEHDIIYDKSNDQRDRSEADKKLQKAAWKRVFAPDSTIGERATAAAVAATMKLKRKMGGKLKSGGSLMSKPMKKKTFKNIWMLTKTAMRKDKTKNLNKNVKKALRIARAAVKTNTNSSKVSPPRIIPVPKIGGILPLVPIFAGLSALGSLIGGSAAITNAVLRTKEANEKLNEAKRHNETMESIAIGKDRRGNGLYLKPYRTGLGLFFEHSKN